MGVLTQAANAAATAAHATVPLVKLDKRMTMSVSLRVALF
jgi:hypothetical protein